MNPYLIELKRYKRKVLSTQIIVFVSFILIWEVLSQFGFINEFLFSSPSKIGKLLVKYLQTNEIHKHVLISLFETIVGLLIGTIGGICIGIILWWFPFVSKVFDPFLGSGTSSVVAKKLGRNYCGIEMNQEYCLWTEKRLEMAEKDSTIQGYSDGVFWERNSLNQQGKNS